MKLFLDIILILIKLSKILIEVNCLRQFISLNEIIFIIIAEMILLIIHFFCGFYLEINIFNSKIG